MAQINLKDMILVSWGKLRRQYLIHYNPQYVKASLERRRGECIRCGTCCRLSVKCPFLDFNTQYPICDFYTFRSNVCRTFPIDAKDLKDRNRLSPGIQCGYWFES
ncbi:MAG: hypothetical protein A2161_05985 [Candidatus Schekmanbacteria bacterium RBG_13_48_7]|uniref:Uncharacterized protein n=1 Tax=Candidatus Schekmanbacteria bacterium RBG_13_48_7 TaxID=1817878 RepID=A0A1F7RLV9_9BACT|nr:MAG: hypothetical protein A2161_05985 [Candidatus Schekmanbacteria bacterium RBG_13_48_7]